MVNLHLGSPSLHGNFWKAVASSSNLGGGPAPPHSKTGGTARDNTSMEKLRSRWSLFPQSCRSIGHKVKSIERSKATRNHPNHPQGPGSPRSTGMLQIDFHAPQPLIQSTQVQFKILVFHVMSGVRKVNLWEVREWILMWFSLPQQHRLLCFNSIQSRQIWKAVTVQIHRDTTYVPCNFRTSDSSWLVIPFVSELSRSDADVAFSPSSCGGDQSPWRCVTRR